MTIGALVTAAVLILVQAAASGPARSELDAVKQLYATAAYEDVLKRLSALDGREDPDQLDQYRALCLVGLGRVAEADQTLERIVLRSPGFQIPEKEVAPAFLARFVAVRKRVLPVAANRLYAKAKTSYDVKDYDAAAFQLQELLTVLRAEAPSGDPALASLQQATEGFLRLTEAERAAVTRDVYTALDFSVIPPVDVERTLPPWNPPAQYRWRWFRGVVDVVVDERGNVESVRLVESLADFYDASLLEAARTWRFKPAQRAGQPVKYRKRMEVTMRPQ
jgi:TonB family protein